MTVSARRRDSQTLSHTQLQLATDQQMGKVERVNPPDDAKLSRLTTSKALALPENVWAGIFSRLPRQKLPQLRRVHFGITCSTS